MLEKLAEFFQIKKSQVIPVFVWAIILTPIVFGVMYLFL